MSDDNQLKAYRIETYVVNDEGAKICKESLDKAGKVFKREPGLEIRRATVEGENRAGIYEITFWQQFKTYATVTDASATAPDVELETTPVLGDDGSPVLFDMYTIQQGYRTWIGSRRTLEQCRDAFEAFCRRAQIRR